MRTSRGGVARRDLLQLGALGALVAGLGNTARSSSPADYRALVCVFLYGGADTFNLVVPLGTKAFGAYEAARGDLAEPKESLLPVDSLAGPLGFHSEAPELRGLFESGRLGVVANVGTLVHPITKAEYVSGTGVRPEHLFSHNSQQRDWQRGWSKSSAATGWIGRTLDRMSPLGYESSLTKAISVHQSDLLLTGSASSGYVIGTGGSLGLHAAAEASRAAALAKLRAQATHPLERELARVQAEVIATHDLLGGLLPSAPTFSGLFPNFWLASQLRMVARLIALRDQLGVSRQVFFVSQGGWDTHDDQPDRLKSLIRELSQSLAAFQAALGEIGAEDEVVTFSHSEFGRTLSSNGKGSDHGWGTHALALGGPVLGGEVYGQLPDFTLGGPDELGGGRVLPSTSVEQYAATLARWYGLSPAQSTAVFPNLANFAVHDLGFLD